MDLYESINSIIAKVNKEQGGDCNPKFVCVQGVPFEGFRYYYFDHFLNTVKDFPEYDSAFGMHFLYLIVDDYRAYELTPYIGWDWDFVIHRRPSYKIYKEQIRMAKKELRNKFTYESLLDGYDETEEVV